MSYVWSSVTQRSHYFLLKKNGFYKKSDVFDARYICQQNTCVQPDKIRYRFWMSVVLSRKFGSSPSRNRARRRVKASFEHIMGQKIKDGLLLAKSDDENFICNIFILIWPKFPLLTLSWEALNHAVLNITDIAITSKPILN